MVDLSVITVTYQSKEWIADQILSVALGAFSVSCEQIVVDNASTDGTADYVEKGYADYVRLIRNKRNVGFARANNQALEFAKGRYLLFLNPDMKIEFGALDRLIPWMDAHPEIGIAGCKLVDESGRAHEALHPRRFPPFLVNLAFFFRMGRWCRSGFYYEAFDPEKEQEVDSVRGAMMLIRREVVDQLGRAFDPRYFLLYEDLDLCREAKGMGYRVVYTPRAACTDLFHRSFLHHSRVWKHWQMSKGLLVYADKWYGSIQKILIFFAVPWGFLLRLPEWLYRWKDSFCKRT